MLSGALDFWHNKLADKLHNEQASSDEIVIIAIDDHSTQAAPIGLGRYTQWGRDNYAKMLESLLEENPKVVAFDLIFNNPSQNVKIEDISEFADSVGTVESNQEKLQQYEEFIAKNSDPYQIEADNIFAQKIEESGSIILSMAGSEDFRILPIKKFRENAELGYVSANPDEDGILRRITTEFNYLNDTHLALGVQAARLAGYETQIPLEDGQMIINYFADPFGYKMVSFVDVVDGDFEPGTFDDKIVLVGITSFKEVQDKVLSPRSNEIPMPGVEVHANVIQTILDGKFLQNQSTISQVAVIALISFGLSFVFNFVGILLSILIAGGAVALYIFMAHFFFDRGLIVNMVYPFVAIGLSYLAAWVYRYFVADKKKREITSAFGHYVSKDLVSEISKNPDMVKLGGEKREVTVFFSDIKDSTTHSEQNDIQQWVSQLNEYFTAMESIIKNLGGTLDKYEGDAIMGFWNAPIAQQDHVARAYSAAIEMQKMLTLLNQKWAKEGRTQIQMRIGINTGYAIVGNFGSKERFDYTVMGDSVNTASRLESAANKAYGTSLTVAGMPQQMPQFTFRELDNVILPGKKQAVKIYELIGLSAESDAIKQTVLKNYSEGLKAYREKNFAHAAGFFKANAEDTPSQVLLERCQKLQNGETISQLDEAMNFQIINK